jgi:ArsR family transcriptional regulator, arsenate/arsenite/antimonite-responsive transcriptional repressor
MANKSTVATMERLFQALADRTRLRILNLIGNQEICVCYFVEVLDEPQLKISRHLAYLRRMGMVAARSEGKWMHYRIQRPANEGAARVLQQTLAWLTEDEAMQADRARLATACCRPEKFVTFQGSPFPLIDLRSRAQGLAIVIEHLSCGVVLLDGNAKPVMLNAAARTILAGNNGLRVNANELGALSHRDQVRLAQLIKMAVARDRNSPTGGAMALARNRLDRPLTVTAFPTHSAALDTGVAAVVFISNPNISPKADLESLAQLYELTPAERRVAILLLKGKTLRDVAESVGVSVHTARSQLKSVLHKTGTPRQSELVKLLLSCALPVAG